MARNKYDVNEDEKKGALSFLYDKSTGACLGRTGKSWALITIFYIIYYSLLAGFFIGMIEIFFLAFIDENQPKLTGLQSLLRGNPGVSFLPKPNVDATIVKASVKNGSDYFDSYIKSVNDVLGTYDFKKLKKNQDKCENGLLPDVSKACYYNATQLGNCANPQDILLNNGSVCIYAKMNKIYGWLPEIQNSTGHNSALIRCTGQNPGDNENMGDIVYNPSIKYQEKTYGYFDSKFFPFLNQTNYMTPLVGIEFRNIKKNIIVLVECKLSNIVFSDLAPVGSGRFEVFVGTN